MKLKLQYFGHLMRRADSFENPTWCWERLRAGGEGDDRGWDGWMASPTQWTWIWVNSRSWWWTGRPGVLRFMGSQRVRHDWATEPNWTSYFLRFCESHRVLHSFYFTSQHIFVIILFCLSEPESFLFLENKEFQSTQQCAHLLGISGPLKNNDVYLLGKITLHKMLSLICLILFDLSNSPVKCSGQVSLIL